MPGFSQDALSDLTVLLVGAGALGGEIAEGLVRKGVGCLKVLDFDTVALSNLNRQWFFPEDLYQPKAWALVRNLMPHGAMGTRLIGWNLSFEDALEQGVDLACGLVICAVDDARTRVGITRFALKRKIPALFSAASRDAETGYVLIQEVGGACFGCAFPDEVKETRSPCPGSPAMKDPFKILAGLALRAVDSLVMDRPVDWNLYVVNLRDGSLTVSSRVEQGPDCPLCGGDSTCPDD